MLGFGAVEQDGGPVHLGWVQRLLVHSHNVFVSDRRVPAYRGLASVGICFHVRVSYPTYLI